MLFFCLQVRGSTSYQVVLSYRRLVSVAYMRFPPLSNSCGEEWIRTTVLCHVHFWLIVATLLPLSYFPLLVVKTLLLNFRHYAISRPCLSIQLATPCQAVIRGRVKLNTRATCIMLLRFGATLKHYDTFHCYLKRRSRHYFHVHRIAISLLQPIF